MRRVTRYHRVVTTAAELRERLDARFDSTARTELAIAGTRAPEGWPTPRLPPALRESITGAALLAEAEYRASSAHATSSRATSSTSADGLPEPLALHYTHFMPRQQIEQLCRGASPAHALLWRPLELAELPRLDAALTNLYALVSAAGLDPAALCGAASPAALIAARPTIAELYVHTLFGRGLPMLGAYPPELAVMARDLDLEAAPEQVIDLHLSGQIVHELCHGPAREQRSPPPPWLLIEAAALHLGACAHREHVFPVTPAEAVPGVSLFVLFGEALARRHGRGALWSLLTSGDDRALGATVASTLAALGWQDWLRRRQPPFSPDALRALDWSRLADAARAPERAGALGQLCLRTEAAGVASPAAIAALLELPALDDAAARTPWSALPWWHDAPEPADLALLDLAVHALLQVHRMAPNFQTHPAEPPEGVVTLDVAACELSRARHPAGVFAEPARWLFPPALARTLAARGAHHVRLTGVSRARAAAAIAALGELCAATTPLPGDVSLDLGR